MFLMETKVCSVRVKQVQCTLGFEGGFIVDGVGKSGGLA